MDEAINKFTARQEALLEEEADAEKGELEQLLKTLTLDELAAAGLAFPRLVVTDVSSGLFGRTIVTFTSKRVALQRMHGSNKQQQEQQQEREKQHGEQLEHRLSPGDIVGVFPFEQPIYGSESAATSGVVHRLVVGGVCVAFEEEKDLKWLSEASEGALGEVFNLCLISNAVTIERQRDALEGLRAASPSTSPAWNIINVSFGGSSPRFLPLSQAVRAERRGLKGAPSVKGVHAAAAPAAAAAEAAAEAAQRQELLHDWREVQKQLDPSRVNTGCIWRDWFRGDLTGEQQKAVYLSLLSLDVAIIHGPPGTGKTTTVVELLLQLLAGGFRVLACAPSNIAVDNMLERVLAGVKKSQDPLLLKQIKKCIRLGHPARIDEQLTSFCLDKHAVNSDASLVAKGVKESIDKSMRQLRTLQKNPAAAAAAAQRQQKQQNQQQQQQQQHGRAEVKSQERKLVQEMRKLKKDLKELQKNAVAEVLKEAPIVFSTCTGAGFYPLQELVLGSSSSSSSSSSGEQRQPFDVVVIDEAAQV